ncbi:hypothetical protein GOODEAATRI_024496 [Goodea atripinnis]|uniref:Uncharacterized protein n=1 Tax=Goodea atripinnis TaxID=208336 RepID=A0ABV0MWV3_9TELE
MAKYKPWLTGCCILLAVICAVALVSLCIATLLGAGCSSGSFRHAAVAADSQLCSEIGKFSVTDLLQASRKSTKFTYFPGTCFSRAAQQ